jgi:hypothetical protein
VGTPNERLAPEPHAVLLVPCSEPLAQPRTQHRRERRRRPFDDGDGAPELGGHRRDLEADEAPADDAHARPACQRIAEGSRVVERAEAEHVAVALEGGQAVRPRSRRHDELPVRDLVAAGEGDAARRGVERDGTLAEEQLEIELLASRRRQEPDVVLRRAPEQEVLGERRPVVGRLDLLGDQRDRAVEAEGAKGLDGPGRREPPADDGDVTLERHRSRPCRLRRT